MRCVLTGATGFVGGAMARQLVARGDDVVAMVRSPVRAQPLADAGVELAVGDLDDVAAMTAALEGADAFFHVAGWYEVNSPNPELGRQVNVVGTRNALRAAAQAGVGKVVYTSTVAVNGDTKGRVVDETYRPAPPVRHVSVYDATKAQAHEIAHEAAQAGLPVVVVMPGGIYGPGDTSQLGGLMRAVAQGRRPVAAPGPRLCMAHVDDVAAGHLLACERATPGEDYMLTGDVTSVGAVLREVARLAGTPGARIVPGGANRALARALQPLNRRRHLPDALSSEALLVTTVSYLGTSAKAQAQLGWQPRPLAEGLPPTVRAWQEEDTGPTPG